MHFEISCNVQFATVFFLIMVSTSSELNNSIDNFRSSFWEEETCISRRRVYYYLCNLLPLARCASIATEEQQAQSCT